MTGIPIVSIGPEWFDVLHYGPVLFEACDLVGDRFDDPQEARACLLEYLEDRDLAERMSLRQRRAAVELFGKEKIAAQWKVFLGRGAQT